MKMNRYAWIALALMAAVMLFFLSCAQKAAGPGAAADKRACLDCHRQPNINTNEGVLVSRAFCSDCHDKPDSQREVGGQKVSLQVPETAFAGTAHQYAACVHCHRDVARSPHRSQIGAQCAACHEVHGEGQAHAPHTRVTCQACHRKSEFVRLDPEDHLVKLARVDDKNNPLGLTDHGLPDVGQETFCQRCHHSGNPVGAPAAVLPAKSFLCIMCHNASLTMGHWIFWAAFLIALIGFFSMVSFWFKGSVGDEEKSMHRKIAISSENIWTAVFSRRFLVLVHSTFLDVLLQRRILKESVRRWSIHSLIYLAFLGRLTLSLITLIICAAFPGSELALALIDKNHWLVAFLNDLLGVSIVLGVLWAVIQRFVVKPAHVLSEEQDTIALVLIGLLVITGFILEGARILVTQVPVETAAYAFGGFVISKVLAALPLNWQVIYGYLWYAHAFLWAAIIAYLPFGKLKHIVTTPLNLIVNAESRE